MPIVVIFDLFSHDMFLNATIILYNAYPNLSINIPFGIYYKIRELSREATDSSGARLNSDRRQYASALL